jgi:type I restriction enzyme S subunit
VTGDGRSASSEAIWLDGVPSHWSIDRLKWSIAGLFNGVWGDEPNGIDDIICVRVADFDRTHFKVANDPPTRRAVEIKDRVNRLLHPGDMLIEKSGGGDNQPVGCVVYFDQRYDAICSNFIGRMVVAAGMHSRYWSYEHAALYAGRLNIPAIKQTTGIQNLDTDAYFNLRVAYPPFDEQRAIANYLDRETAQIDALVAAKERLLTLLAEKRRALITRAVTRGLNSDVPLRESGLPWLGEVPAHWEVTRLKFVADVQGGLALGKNYGAADTAEYPYLRVANVQDGYLDLSEITTVLVPENEAKSCLLQSGDVLMNEGGDADKLGRGCIWLGEINPCLHQNHVFAVRPKLIRSEWLDAWTSTDTAKAYFESRAKQSTNLASISGTNIKELPILVPPDEEQRAIVAHIAAETARLDALAAATKRSIALLKERRAALIAAAVTGRMQISEAA